MIIREFLYIGESAEPVTVREDENATLESQQFGLAGHQPGIVVRNQQSNKIAFYPLARVVWISGAMS